MIVRLEPDSLISASQRAFLYGDGCFTTAKVSQGKVECLSLHIQRLKHDCDKLAITYKNWDQLTVAMQVLAHEVEKDQAVVKVLISRGAGSRGYSTQGITEATAFLQVNSFPDHYIKWQEQGLAIQQAENKLAYQPMLAGIKHLNRLEQILLKREQEKKGADELVVTDYDGNLVEAVAGNLFWYTNGNWFTPKLSGSGVLGVMRESVLIHLKTQNQVCHQVNVPVQILMEAEAVMITNCLYGLLPVNSFKNLSGEISRYQMQPVKKLFAAISQTLR